MNRITEQTWQQLATQFLALVGLVLTIGNQVGWWTIGDDTMQSILQTLTIVLAFAATLLYGINSTPNTKVDEMVSMAYDRGHEVGAASAAPMTPLQASIDPRVYKGGL